MHANGCCVDHRYRSLMQSSSAIKVSELSANVAYHPFALTTSDHFVTSRSTRGWLKRNSLEPSTEPASSRPNTAHTAWETANSGCMIVGQQVQHNSSLGRCRGWLTDRGSNGRRCREYFWSKHDIMFEAELKRRRQAPYPGFTCGMAAAVQ